MRNLRTRERNRKAFFENLGYVILITLIIAQCTVGGNFYLGQFLYLFANIVAVIRSFVLKRPAGDKVKDCCCLAITVGLIIFSLF